MNYSENRLVTVLMPCYNEPECFFRAAIESVINQTYKNLEILLILDNPQNELLSRIAREYQVKNKQIRLVINDQNLKLTKTLNKGLKLASGDVIARFDADDIMLPNRIQKQMQFVDQYDLISTNFAFINNNGYIIRHRIFPSTTAEIYYFLCNNADCMYHTTWLGKKETFFKLNGYREIGPFEDYDFLLRAIKMGLKLFNCPEELNYYRINTEGISYKNKIFQHLGSEYIRDNYTRINTITKEEIISYLKSSVGKTHAKEYKNFCRVTTKLYSSKKITGYYFQLLIFGPYLALFNYYGRKKILNLLKRMMNTNMKKSKIIY